MIIKNNNPWLGLSSYQTSDSFRFFGRERDMEEIGNSIKDSFCTILYGVSGAGKTSIINAGLSPKLSSEGYLPITIRLEHNGRVYSDQIISACFSKFDQTETEFECPFSADKIHDLDARDALWVFFHASTFWSKDNRKVVPVLFIDQFEELFTLADTEDQKLSFFRQIDSLFSSVPSERLISYLEDSNSSFDFSETSQFRMVFSMREDFLARLEDYCYDLPILRKNRIGLRKMNGLQALDVIIRPQPGLVTEEVALKILAAITGKNFSGNKAQLQAVEVDTSILSLFCSELFNLSADKAEDIISSATVESEGKDILKRFYEKNISVLSRRGRRYLEQHLLTSGGFRNQLAVEDINRTLVKDADIQALESSRIIRKEIINGTERIEFTHDILCKAAKESTRKEKERNEGLSSGLTYFFFACVCFFIVAAFRELIFDALAICTVSCGDDPNRLVIAAKTIVDLLLCAFGFFYLPECIPFSRKNNRFINIISVVFSVVIIMAHPYSWKWYAITFIFCIISLINFCSVTTPEISFRDYCKSILRLSLNKEDKWTMIIIYSAILWGIYGTLRTLRYTYFRLEYSKFSIPIVCIIAAIVIVSLFILIISLFVKDYFKRENRKRILYWSIPQVAILSFYLLSQYSHSRWISYVSLTSLIGISIYLLYSFLLSLGGRKRYSASVCGIVSICLLCVLPNYVSGINILALKNNSRVLRQNAQWWNMTKIVSQDGLYGVMEGSKIIVPPRFVEVSEDKRDTYSFRWIESRTSGMRNRLSTTSLNSYIVRDITGDTYTWRILEHPEINNRYTRMIPKIVKANPYEKYETELAVNYYYQKSIIEGNKKCLDDYYLACDRLFRLNRTSKSPASIYDALKNLIKTKAIYSDRLLDSIFTIIRSYDDSDYYIEKAKCKGLLCLIRKEYDAAVTYAKESSDDFVLAEALLLSDNTDHTLSILLKRTTSSGQFIGESIIEDIKILSGDRSLKRFPCLKDYLALPENYAESISLDHYHIRRNLYTNGKVLFLEAGKITSEYQRIVYPSVLSSAYPGVYFRNDKRGFISWDGHEVTDAKFDHAWLFSEHNGLAVVEVDGKIGFINKDGKYRVSPSIAMQPELRDYKDWIFEADGKLLFPGEDRKFGLLGSDGQWVISPQYGDIEEYNYGFRVFADRHSAKYGLLDSQGDVIFPQEFVYIEVGPKYIEVRDTNYVISYFMHDGEKILGKVLDRDL